MAGGDGRLSDPAALRTREPILQVLARVLPPRGLVLHVAEGCGEHIVHFAAGLPGLEVQPTDPDLQAVRSIAAWITASGLANIRAPALFDVRDAACLAAAAAGGCAMSRRRCVARHIRTRGNARQQSLRGVPQGLKMTGARTPASIGAKIVVL